MKRQSPRFFLNLQKPLPAVQQEEIFQHHLPGAVALDQRKILPINPGKHLIHFQKDGTEILDFFVVFAHDRLRRKKYYRKVYHRLEKKNRGIAPPENQI